MKTIYDPRYRRLIGKLKQVRHKKQLRQVDAAARLGRSRKWLGKIETHDLRLDVLCFVCLCKAYGIKASRLIRELEEEPSEDDGFSLGILDSLECNRPEFNLYKFLHLTFTSINKYPD